ncbi:MAG TPA: TadE/TadG family type IV pilus assembly protein [Gemmatimonadales bacterium]|jgi:Flp pilus assembly protein TadG|nr:TadE/TadG family type IV pilus assembly protein [Gemmatimonadales bacterium]
MEPSKETFRIGSRGQSLVEFGLALPLLMLLFLGLIDGARAYYYAGSVANAAHEAASFAARNASATRAQVTQRACDATGFATFGTPCTGLSVTCTLASGDVSVEVTYNFTLISGLLTDGAFHVNPLPIRGQGRYPLTTIGSPCAT